MSTYGFNEFERRLRQLAEESPEVIDRQVARWQMMVLADTKLGTPVKSGNLKRKWTTSTVQNGSGEVGTNVEYAPHVEKGFTHKNGGQKVQGIHMLEKAVEQMNNRIPDEINRMFDELAGDLRL